MDANNWRPTAAAQGAEPSVETGGDWRTQLSSDSRKIIVNKIVETLKRHPSFSGQEGLEELKKISVHCEEKIYAAASSKSDYLRKITLKFLTMESKSQNTILNSLPPNSSGNNNLPPNSGVSLDSTVQTRHSNGGDWQEEIYQKIKAMKEMYLPELYEMYQLLALEIQKQNSPPPALKMFKTVLDRIIALLQVPKCNILPSFKEKLCSYEKDITMFIEVRKSIQQTQSQVSQVQSHENQVNPQIQSMNLQRSVPNMEQNIMAGLQYTSLSSLSGVSTSQKNIINSLQPPSSLDSGQGNAMGSLSQTTVRPLQQNNVSAPQQGNVTNISSLSGVDIRQPNIPLQSNHIMLRHQHLKQQLQMQCQPRKQFNQQGKQKLFVKMQAHKMPQVHQMNDINRRKIRQWLGVKRGVFWRHISGAQRTAHTHQQMKSAASKLLFSLQLLRVGSPQFYQYSSLAIGQQNVLPSLTKARTLLQFANSPFIVPTPSIMLAPSSIRGDSEKPVPGLSLLSNAGNLGQEQATVARPPASSLAIGTPGVCRPPLPVEFIVSDGGGHNNPLGTIASGKSSVTKQLPHRLIREVKSISSQALNASFNDIGSVVGNGHTNGGHWKEEVHRKHDSLTPPLNTPEMREKVILLKSRLESLISFLQVSKKNISLSSKENFATYEKQIMHFINTYKHTKSMRSQRK